MNSAYILCIIIFLATQNVSKKAYNKKTWGNGALTFSLMSAFSTLIFFFITMKKPCFIIDILPYSLGFGVFYAMAVVFSVLAISCGSLSITALINSYSLMIPTLYGFIFLGEPIKIWLISGIVFLFISLFLIKKRGEEKKISAKWILYVILSFAGNGLCSVVQKMQQVRFQGEYKNEFMIIALIFVVIAVGIIVAIKERKETYKFIKNGFWAVISGIANGFVNLFVMILSGDLNASLMFPMISSGGIVLTFFISKYIYKENLNRRQLIGFLFGILSIILLNL